MPMHRDTARVEHTQVMSVFEHQRLEAQDFADAHDFAWLLAKELPVFSISRVRGRWQLKIGHHIGMVLLPSGRVLEILPKRIAGQQQHEDKATAVQRGRQWVSCMLADLSGQRVQQRHYRQFARPLTPMDAQPPLSTWLPHQFLQQLSAYRPAAAYMTAEVNDTRLQGKLMLREHLQKNAHQPHKFACQVSRRSHNTLVNRFINSALQLLDALMTTRFAKTSVALQWQRARHYWQRIDCLSVSERQQLAVSYQLAQRHIRTEPLSGQARLAAQQLLTLSHWLLTHQPPRTPSGSVFAAQGRDNMPLRLCILLNMNHAFEQWVSGCVQNQLSAHAPEAQYRVQYQPRARWLQDTAGQAHLTVQPDVVVSSRRDGQQTYSHVIDVKWKYVPHASLVGVQDAYQLMSYAAAYDAPTAWLVYPVLCPTAPTALTLARTPTKANTPTLWLIPFDVLQGRLMLEGTDAVDG
ncbi:5-methylcytosine restriction system specificity protein McrC [Psychrobacter aestuarii]|uniref:Restriction endonuclease n=1 Tax=Psychrobacter aestuarii TaxID=556327 RepID=A0ABN0VL87_9GAMM|nr:hypothetical protein [Psychrobacter aestuarii]